MLRTNLSLRTGRITRSTTSALNARTTRGLASAAPQSPIISTSHDHKVIVVGGGSAGLTVSHQLLRSGKFRPNDIAVVDPATWHHYQPGWTLVGAGLKDKQDLRKPLKSLVDSRLKFYNEKVGTFSPEENFISLGNGGKLNYEQLVVAPGINVNTKAIKGLPEALANSESNVSSVYTYDSCSKVFPDIANFRNGNAIFTHPVGVIKCAGAPQKIMWLALDHWKKAGLYNLKNLSSSPIQISFSTGLPVMFGVPKYSKKLNELREQKGVEGLFEHDLVAIEGNTAVFSLPNGKEQVKKHFDFMHVVPKMGPHTFVKNSVLANEAGFVEVDEATTRHKKFANIWSIGDASSLPTSKTAAAITAQAPVLVRNLLRSMEGEQLDSSYNGYTSCPLLTEYGKVMLAEFKYGSEPQETFGNWFGIDQAVPRRAFYHLKKDFFPWVYYKSMVKGTWGGPKGWLK